jgi:succinate dehydrogenase/fumarate reductase flavoprotein subunit
MAGMQEVMMEKVSVFRMESPMTEALEKIKELKERYQMVSLQDKGSCFNRDLLDALELGHMLDLAEVITMGALYRQESRGAHFREDFPERNDATYLVHTLVRFTDKGPQILEKPVTITRFQPKERKY